MPKTRDLKKISARRVLEDEALVVKDMLPLEDNALVLEEELAPNEVSP